VTPSSFDVVTWQRDIILHNVEIDPHYAPYCLRCEDLVRMRVVERLYWHCRCCAQCDYRPQGRRS
jgi:hypothetical protein